MLLIDQAVGGRSRLSEDGYLEGAPELVAEIAASSAAYDLYDKKNAYRRNGVQEYVVWLVLDQKLDSMQQVNPTVAQASCLHGVTVVPYDFSLPFTKSNDGI